MKHFSGDYQCKQLNQLAVLIEDITLFADKNLSLNSNLSRTNANRDVSMEGKLFEPLGHVGEGHGESLDGCERVLKIQGVSVGVDSSKLHHLKNIDTINKVFRL